MMKRTITNKWAVSVLLISLFSSLLIATPYPVHAQTTASSEMTPTLFQDITWYEDKAIFATSTHACSGYNHWMMAEKVNHAWQIIHAEKIPSFFPDKDSLHDQFETLRPTRLRVYQNTLYILATNEYHDISETSGNTAYLYCYDLKTLSYRKTISLPIDHRIHDFVFTDTGKMITLTDTGLHTYQNSILQILQPLDTPYHELQWMDETTLCIGSFAYNQDPQTKILQYDLETQELSTLYAGQLPIHDIAVADHQTIYAIAQNPETKLYQLYHYQDHVFSLFDSVQRLSYYSQVLLDQDHQTPITINIFTWSNPILYTRQNDTIVRQPMQFSKSQDSSLQYPVCLHASSNQTSVLVNKGICIYEDANPQPLSSKWEDTTLQIPYETCNDIVKFSQQTYLVLANDEFCIVRKDGYIFSESWRDTYSFCELIPIQQEYYIRGIDRENDSTWVLLKINLDDCTLQSTPVLNLPIGPIAVFNETIFVYNNETIIKGIIQGNSFVQQEVLPAPALYWDAFTCNTLFFNPENNTFVLIEKENKRIRATFLQYNSSNEAFPVGLIYYHYIAPPTRGYTSIDSLSFLNGHVTFLTREGYGRMVQF
jgi:hypothetical protein